jgi:hypothetical protein
MPTTTDAIGRRRRRPARSTKPKHLNIAGESFTRNDIAAKEKAMSERGLNRLDKDGYPYIYLGGIKYRPDKAGDQYFLSRVIYRSKPTRGRRGGRT